MSLQTDIYMDWLQFCKIWKFVCSCPHTAGARRRCLALNPHFVFSLGHMLKPQKPGASYCALNVKNHNNTVSVTSLLGGSSDNTGSSMARRLVLKTGLNIILASNIPKNSPMIEVAAEKVLVQKLVTLGYIRPKSEGPSR
ncbi:uncharacterized protein LOC103490859 isoform X2 [Cucumis melo]|uniref:Uncharacterized protein LOC103490859 isoform X2 n=1 Tax=Cucumis melo TaxID=3656 RepID=A0ABM3L5G7_CUCME|nr:uncharacterized protein LOC103490859 isoform X2 [Cucumis melo]